ncbi:antibiotic biosynthesis monooxygenase family protein [Methylobacterium sp. sgz302541]|uniref:antibiotic biosynthesis monooxygenase family protein n=1 Tax=unclassified Methylobacterium TaxID=2615210 RepID=UPI003D35863D
MFCVVFEVRPGEGRKDAYLALAAEMRPVLESIDGFLDNERFGSRTRPGWVLSLSTWRDEKSVIRWRTEARHHLTQRKGRDAIFSDYRLRVGEVTGDTALPVGAPLRGQRFDATEIGEAKALTITEAVPGSGTALSAPDAEAAGLVGHDLFESITAPGKLLLLASWAGAEAADAFRPAAPASASPWRHRSVRVIREYGLHDRREAPQYHPAVAP